MSPWFFKLLATPTICVLLGISASAQADPRDPAGTAAPYNALGQPSVVVTKGSVLMLSLYSDKHIPLDRQALVQLTNKSNQSVQSQITENSRDNSGATFIDLPGGDYDIAVSALGYLTLHQELSLNGRITTNRVEITLKKDPSAIDLGAVKSREMPARSSKDMLRGLSALKSGRLEEAQRKLDAAYKVDPSNSEVNFLLGYLYFEKHDPERAQAYLVSAAKLAPHNVQALTLLGRVQMQRQEFAAARSPLEQAVAVDPDNWMAHSLLANVYLEQKEFDRAREQAQIAIERGKGAANSAELALGQALTNLGRYDEALKALETFLQGAPGDPNTPQVRRLIAEIKQRESPAASNVENKNQSPSPVSGTEPMLAAPETVLAVNGWEPAGIDEVKPPVASDTSCPYDKVVQQTGVRVKEFVDDLAKFNAIEDVLHEQRDELGNPKKSITLKFDYVASISEPQPGRFLVDEFRTGLSGTEDFPDQIATRGLPTLAFIFHPDMRDDFDMICEGLGTWDAKATWVVHFRQREDRPHRIQDYVINGKVYPVSLKGRAWISANTFQIVRLESELVKPMPEIQLVSEHQTVEYAPVPFPKRNVELWLPKSADLYFDFRKHRYFRRHSFDHFLLFTVDTEEKRKAPPGE